MKTVILNTSILTAFGRYRYVPTTLETAKGLLHDSDQTGIPVTSAIGHATTAEILTELLGRPVPMNRIEYKQEVGDAAVVFKLRGRPPEGKVLTREEVEAVGYDFGILYRDS